MACSSSSSFTLNSLRQKRQLFHSTLCKSSSTLNLFFIFSSPKHSRELSPLLLVRRGNAVCPVFVSKLSSSDHERHTTNTLNHRTVRENRFGFRSLRPRDAETGKKSEKQCVSENCDNDDANGFDRGKNDKRNKGLRKMREMGDGNSSLRSRDRDLGAKSRKNGNGRVVNNVKRSGEKMGNEKGKGPRKSKVDSTEVQFRVGLDMCSKKGDVMSAIELFDSAQREGIELGQYHYTVLLYLCSSAAVGVVRPAKSGNDSRSLDALESNDETSGLTSVDLESSGGDLDVSVSENGSLNSGEGLDNGGDGGFDEKERLNWFCNGFVKRSYRLLDGLSHHPAMEGGDEGSLDAKNGIKNKQEKTVRVDDELKEYARKRGFEIYEKMRSDKVPMNEAALTSVARMAMSIGDGDVAFEMVKQMKSLGINPRLRSYGPALSAFVSSGEIDKAFSVEEHMLEHGVYPEEPELQALLRASVVAGKGDRVYYLLHKLRASVRKVSNSTADLIVDWFESKAASRAGKTKWDKGLIKKAIGDGGGGWHGQGWLGRGKWSVVQTTVGTDGLCQCCGEKLAIIDLDPKETEIFAESVASIVMEKEKHSSFQKFQNWLDYYGPFEAVVDGANIGLFSQKRFMPAKIKAVVNVIRQKLPSKKWPLIVLHNRRTTGPKMKEPSNRALLDKWQNADAIYATPTGSNDDWYWLYAAIKFKCLLVTNDEMRDHTFQLLWNDFFPRWKERHQVRFTFIDGAPELHMPPPCSVVIQESETGQWHIPISTEHEYEAERPWLCIMRAKSRVNRGDSKPRSEGSVTETKSKSQSPLYNGKDKSTASESHDIYKNLRDILSGPAISDHYSILPQIQLAEKLSGKAIDFQI